MELIKLYDIYCQYLSIQTDTRKLKKGDLFFALKGPTFNGNFFAKKALEQGAAYCIVDEDIESTDPHIIKVDDVLSTLQALAKYHRQQFNIPVIAVTGSNGKTTTKELIHEVLSSRYKTYTTVGNLNNHIGIPLTLLAIKKDAQMAVIEMGANHQKEIESYCSYALPTHGLITNCGKAHLEGFGGIEGVKKGKGELYDFLGRTNGTVFIMNDYDYLKEMATKVPHQVSYGTHDADVTGEIVTEHEFLHVSITKGAEIKTIKTHLVGSYNLPNVLAAVAIGKHFLVEDSKIQSALENYIPSNSRSQMLIKDSNKIILDAYNANPSSMKAAIENLAQMDGENKVLLLGGMMELGNDSIKEHQNIVDLLQQFHWKNVVLVNGDYDKTKHSYLYFRNADEAKDWYKNQFFLNSTILIKGSRSVQMEKILA